MDYEEQQAALCGLSEARELLKRAASVLHDKFDGVKYMEPLIEEIDAYLAKPEPEPVAYEYTSTCGGRFVARRPPVYARTPLRLYAGQPTRNPLTEQEILDCAEKTWHKFDLDDDVSVKGLVNIVREIEKAHGIG